MVHVYISMYTLHIPGADSEMFHKRGKSGENFWKNVFWFMFKTCVYHTQKLHTQRTVFLWFILSDILVIVVCIALLYSSLLHLKIQTGISPQPSSKHASRYFFFNCTVHLTLWTQPKEPNRTWMEQTYTLVVVRWKLILPRYVYNNEKEGILRYKERKKEQAVKEWSLMKDITFTKSRYYYVHEQVLMHWAGSESFLVPVLCFILFIASYILYLMLKTDWHLLNINYQQIISDIYEIKTYLFEMKKIFLV